MAHSKKQKCIQNLSSRKYTCEWFKYKCSLCKLRFMSRKDKLNHELGFHCLKRRGSNFILKFYSHHLRPFFIFSHVSVFSFLWWSLNLFKELFGIIRRKKFVTKVGVKMLAYFHGQAKMLKWKYLVNEVKRGNFITKKLNPNQIIKMSVIVQYKRWQANMSSVLSVRHVAESHLIKNFPWWPTVNSVQDDMQVGQLWERTKNEIIWTPMKFGYAYFARKRIFVSLLTKTLKSLNLI